MQRLKLLFEVKELPQLLHPLQYAFCRYAIDIALHTQS